MPSVGSELLNEIERISAKRERWKETMALFSPRAGAGLRLSITMTTMEIEAAKKAIADDDAVAAILSLKALQAYDYDSN